MNTHKKLLLNIRDIALRDNFTGAEKLNFIALFIAFITLTWNLDSRSIWTSCFLLIIGTSSIINIKIHDIVHPFIIDKLWTKLLFLNLPAIFLLIIYFLTALGNCIELISLGDASFLGLNSPENIFSTNVAFKENWILFLSTISLFFLCTHLLIIPKSLYFIHKFISWCSVSIFFIILIGFIFKASDLAKPLFSTGTGQIDFFFYFPYDGDWAAFALLWMYVSYAISKIEYEKNDLTFTKTNAPFYLALCTALASTTLIIQESIPSLFLSFAFVHICLLTYQYYKERKESVLKLIGPYIFFLGFGSAIKGIYTFVQINTHNSEAEHLKKSGLEMIADSPLFGWGINSFQKLSPYYNDASLINLKYEGIPSSAINLLLEFGFIGMFIICLYALILYLNYLIKKQNNPFSNTLFFALFLIILLSFFDNPFYSIPTTFSFWIIGFLAIRWAQLVNHSPDEVDTKEDIMIIDIKRNVPFVTDPTKEVFK
ncbi:MAG: O-antigen ligase family protein [Opitutales bacterium]